MDHPHYERVALAVSLVLVAGIGFVLLGNESTVGFVGAPSVGTSGVSITTSGNIPGGNGLFQYCYDSDGGKNPGVAGMVVEIASPAPLPNGLFDFLDSLSTDNVSTVGSTAVVTAAILSEGMEYRIGNIRFSIFPDLGAGGVLSLPGVEPTNGPEKEAAILSEKYCETYRGQTHTGAPFVNHYAYYQVYQGKRVYGEQISSDFLFLDFMLADRLE